MTTFNRCMDCKFAKWERTSKGRLHPNGQGKCLWIKKIVFPASMSDSEQNKVRRELENFHYINRQTPINNCATFSRVD